jgi:hypothetical protein
MTGPAGGDSQHRYTRGLRQIVRGCLLAFTAESGDCHLPGPSVARQLCPAIAAKGD